MLLVRFTFTALDSRHCGFRLICTYSITNTYILLIGAEHWPQRSLHFAVTTSAVSSRPYLRAWATYMSQYYNNVMREFICCTRVSVLCYWIGIIWRIRAVRSSVGNFEAEHRGKIQKKKKSQHSKRSLGTKKSYVRLTTVVYRNAKSRFFKSNIKTEIEK